MSIWVWFWLIVFIVGLIIEGVALARKDKRDTLSEQVWTIRTFRVGKFLIFPAWAWLTWHWLLEPYSLFGMWWDDIFVLFIGFILANVIEYPGRMPNEVDRKKDDTELE